MQCGHDKTQDNAAQIKGRIDIGKVNIGYPIASIGFPERGNWEAAATRLHPSLQNESEVLVCQVSTLGIWILFDSDTASQSVTLCPLSPLSPSPSQRRPQLGLKIDFDFQSGLLTGQSGAILQKY